MLHGHIDLPIIRSGVGRFELDIHQIQTGRNTRWIVFNLTHILKTWKPHPRFKLRDGFGIPNPILDQLDHTKKHSNSMTGHLDPAKIGSGTGRFELDISQKGQEGTLMIDSILTHSIKAWQHHSNLEFRD